MAPTTLGREVAALAGAAFGGYLGWISAAGIYATYAIGHADASEIATVLANPAAALLLKLVGGALGALAGGIAVMILVAVLGAWPRPEGPPASGR